MESSILRIYRRKGKQSRILVGTVEEIGKEGKRSFGSYDELWALMNPKRKDSGGAEKAG